MKVVIIDCFDSFTYNLYQLVGSLGAEPLTITCDQPLSRILDSDPDRIILSPGPGTPDESGICPAVIRKYAGTVPILGVCLGHQTIIQTFGGTISRMEVPRHGKTSTIIHTGTGLFRGLPNPFPATRYHSLMVIQQDLPEDFDTVAIASDDSCVMSVAHREMPVFGVQFHPESIMTPAGAQLIGNFLAEGA